MHEVADNFVQCETWNEKTGKGCSIGCVNHNYSHEEIAEKYNVPLFFVKNADSIFEGLSVYESKIRLASSYDSNFFFLVQTNFSRLHVLGVSAHN